MTDQVVNTQQRSNIVHALLNWTSGILSNYPIDSWNLAAGFIPAANAIKKNTVSISCVFHRLSIKTVCEQDAIACGQAMLKALTLVRSSALRSIEFDQFLNE